MKLLKKIKESTIIFFITLFLFLISFEIYATLNFEKFPSYGWQGNNLMYKKIKKCNNKIQKKIGVFGDSTVEYFAKKQANIVVQLDKRFSDYSLCNFGISGHGIGIYINRFLFSLDANIQFDKIIFYFFEDNDFSSFRYLRENQNFNNKENLVIRNVYDYNTKDLGDRKFNTLKSFIKNTYSLNIIYREIIKRYLIENEIDEKFINKIYNQKKYTTQPLEDAIEQMKKTPIKLKKKFSIGKKNIEMYKLALRNPNYYQEIHNPSMEDFLLQKKIASHHIDFINNKCEIKKIECKFIVIPSPNFLFKESKNDWEKIYRYNYYSVFGPSKISKFLESKYENFYYPKNILEYKDFIKFDPHLNENGNRKIAEFTYMQFN